MPKHLPGSFFLRNLVERRALIFQMVKRDFQQRYVGSAAGWVWGLIHPLVVLFSYWFIFGYILQTRAGSTQAQGHYSLFLFSGMLPWMLFSETLTRSTSSMLDQASLITKTVFPAEIVPITIFLSAMVNHLLAVAMLFTAVLVILHQASVSLLLLPLCSALLGLLAIGLAWVSSSFQVYLRDTIQVVNVILIFWMWITPIFVEESFYRGKTHLIVVLNPITYVVRCYRDVLLEARPPSLHDVSTLLAISVAAFVVGGLFFRLMKRGFADVL